MRELNEEVKEYFAREGTVATWWNVENIPYYQKEIKILNDKLNIKPNLRVLDIGTGRGRFAIYFASMGCKVTAVDISSEMLGIAKNNAQKEGVTDRIEFVLADAEDLSNIGIDYDIITCMETFDHIPNTKRAIQEIGNKIKIKGLFGFSYTPTNSLYWLFRDSSQINLNIARAYNNDHIQKILNESNFNILGLFGISLLHLTSTTLPKNLRKLFRILNQYELSIKSYYHNSFLVKRCATIVGIANKRAD